MTGKDLVKLIVDNNLYDYTFGFDISEYISKKSNTPWNPQNNIISGLCMHDLQISKNLVIIYPPKNCNTRKGK